MDDTSITCLVKRPYDFAPGAFAEFNDQFRNAVVLPRPLFDRLGIEPYGYVAVAPETDAEAEQTGSRVVHAVPFGQETPVVRVDGAWVVAARTNVLVGACEGGVGDDRIRIGPIDSPSSGALTVRRTYDDEVAERACYVSPTTCRRVGLDDGDRVEVFNPGDGGRKLVAVSERPEVGEGDVRLDARSRLTLGVDLGDSVVVRRAVDLRSPAPTLRGRALERLVGYREVPLRVEFGLDRDEYRNVARLSAEMMAFLGIDPGDRLVVDWKGQTAVTQCLSPPPDEAVSPVSILLPSTERDRVNVSIGDTVSARRDMGHVFRKRIALSTLGILGVTFGVFQGVGAVGLASILVQRLGVGATLLALLALSGVISLLVVWLLLFPERGKCARITANSAR